MIDARRLRLLLALFLSVPALSACVAEIPGTPVAVESLCARISEIVCDSDAACFPGAALEDCAAVQLERCDAVVLPLAMDPRLGYDELRAGAFVDSLRERGEACWQEPVDFDAFLDVFTGTGAIGADCTPASLDAASLRASSLSCAGGAACRLYLRADASNEGVCEARRDAACSHAFDCGAGEFCSLPGDWQPGVWGDCRPLRIDGWACGSDLECASRHCDGTCAARPEIDRPLAVSYADLVLDAAPIAYLRFSEAGTRVTDASGNGHGGELIGGAVRDMEGAIEGDPSGAVRLAGDGQHVRVAALDELEESGALSLECWFLRDDTEEARPILELSDGTDLGPHVWNHDRGDKLFANFVGAETGEHPIMSGEGVVSAEEWHHVVATFDGAMGRLYLDGVRVGETMVGDDALRLDGDLYVGYRAAIGEATARSFAGSIDEVAIYDRALDEATIRRHHAAGVAGTLENEFPLYSWLGR